MLAALAAVVLVALAAAPGARACPNSYAAGTYALTLTHDGEVREYDLFVPRGLLPTQSVPVVFNFHGYTSTNDAQEPYTHMNSVAERQGWLAVHAQGIQRSWNAGACCGTAQFTRVDDVGFVRAMLAELSRRMCVNKNAVFSTGMSNGGFLSHRLACEASDIITAIAPVCAVLAFGSDFNACRLTRPVPIVHFHGTEDNLVPYDGNIAFPSVNSSVTDWVQRNGCTGAPVVTLRTASTTCQRWGNCNGGADVTVELCTVEGLGHTWPGSTDPRQPVGTVNATEYMVANLFRRFSQFIRR
eukprot:Unigene2907_Nuclearia_a/m.8978 Unigene2907_Nuclearia_a/g.8978  ORF Unigene2907_Nuclearia_a/g.8978 Unigene2907_Nuclearia_a/m.8978 type:complete len:299 (-) Unigene2907_Nuclearia_a:68-964(-)